MGHITKYYTPRGNVLEVDATELPEKPGMFHYIFTLHEKREHGENITVLQSADLYSPDFWVKKYKSEY